MTKTYVYVTMAGWDYEGADEGSVKVFSNRGTAEAWVSARGERYDWVKIREMVVDAVEES